jgi:Fe-S-cluster containining protein
MEKPDVGISRRLFRPDRRVPYVCLGSECPNTCCGPFHGTRALSALTSSHELGEIILGPCDPHEQDTADDISVFAQIRLMDSDVMRLQGAGLDNMIVRRGLTAKPVYYLRLLSDGTCASLSVDRVCTIYHARPTLCRAFPFYFDLFAGLSMVESCPGVGAGESAVVDVRESIKAAVEMYESWLADVRSAMDESSG